MVGSADVQCNGYLVLCLSEVLGVSSILIRDYRLLGKKPRGEFLAQTPTEEWEIKGEGWVRK